MGSKNAMGEARITTGIGLLNGREGGVGNLRAVGERAMADLVRPPADRARRRPA
jgi:hypothetical protein